MRKPRGEDGGFALSPLSSLRPPRNREPVAARFTGQEAGERPHYGFCADILRYSPFQEDLHVNRYTIKEEEKGRGGMKQEEDQEKRKNGIAVSDMLFYFFFFF